MRLSNTMIMNESLLPSNKKAFTLAEVLITLSILGVVAALTIPSLVNRQNEMAAIVKLKKAISTYESVVEVYMAEEEATDFSGVVGTAANTACTTLQNYFKMTEQTGTTNGCMFATADGVVWNINNAGYATILDSAKAPRYGVIMWTRGGLANSEVANGVHGDTRPLSANIAIAPTGTFGGNAVSATVQHGYRKAADMLNINKSQNAGADAGSATPTTAGIAEFGSGS